MDSNDKGDWYNWKIEKGDFLNDEATFDAASAFNESFRKGKVVASYEEDETSEGQKGDIPF